VRPQCSVRRCSRRLWPPSGIMVKMHGERPPVEYEHRDFKHGRDFEEDILTRLDSSVHHPCSYPSGSFLMLTAFRRSSFRLTEESVSMALHSVIGGSPGGFHIFCIKPCHFQFSVASKAVGFLVRALKRITTKNLNVYFHLWRDGGANWPKEFRGWEDEEGQWTLVTKKWCSSSKQVRFSSPTKLPSLTVKKSPTLGVSAIKLASFSYPLQDRRHASTAHSPPSSSVIPASRVIDNLRHDLNLKFQNPTVKSTSSLRRPKRELVTPPPPPPNCPDHPVPQIRRGVLSVPCTPTTSTYKLQSKTRSRACICALPHVPWL
jgi:hypothetical protein